MNTVTRILTLILSATLFAATTMAESAADLLQRGMDQETTNPDAAARAYQQIVDNAEADRPAQAEAYLRLAQYLAKENQKAKAADLLNRLVRDYSDQARILTRARTELAKLRPADPTGAPAIVSTTPETFQNNVDPSLDRLEVTFDQPMRDQSWSWTGGGETYPDVTGKISYDAARTTCSLPVKLRPGKVYWVGINSPSNRNFISQQGTPAEWYIILFATSSADGKPTPIPQNLQRRAKQINERPGQSGSSDKK